MKATTECYPCLGRLVRQAAELATGDPELRAKAIDAGFKLLDREFSTQKTSIAVATPLHRLVRAITGNKDPYLQMKEAEVMIANKLRQARKDDFDLENCLVFAARGNCIDFFKDITAIREDLEKPVEFVLDHTDTLERKLLHSKRILFLADNTGEVFFDLPLVKKLETFAPVTYAVKGSPVQNDVTIADLHNIGLAKEFSRVITTGTDTPGVDMSLASDEFRAEFEGADLVLAKGMGYWETLSELPAQGKVFYILKAKCQPVADSLGVTLNSYVALLR